MDLQFKTGTQTTNQRFYLSDLGDHKAISGYPWFTAFQPRVDWKRGWIDISQLLIVLSAPNAAKAMYTPRTKNVPQTIKKTTDRYFLGRVTIGSTTPSEPNSAIPKEYQRHSKVFSKAESQRLPQSTIWDHAIELLPRAPDTLPGRLLPLTQEEKAEMHKFIQEHLKRGTICMSKSPYAAQLLFHKKERWKTMTSTRLPTHQQMDKKEQKCISSHSPSDRSPQQMHQIHGCRCLLGL